MPVLVGRRKPIGWPNPTYLEEDYQVYHGSAPIDGITWADRQSADNWIWLLQKEAHGLPL